jgi:hypothetical protein
MSRTANRANRRQHTDEFKYCIQQVSYEGLSSGVWRATARRIANDATRDSPGLSLKKLERQAFVERNKGNFDGLHSFDQGMRAILLGDPTLLLPSE